MSLKPPTQSEMTEHQERVARLVDQLRAAGKEQAGLVEALVSALQFERSRQIPTDQSLLHQLRRVPGSSRPLNRCRTAIISDIHGNLNGLTTILKDVEQQDCAQTVCLGDLIDGGPENDAVVSLIKELGIPTVLGNHDENREVPLSDVNRRFLDELPDKLRIGETLFTHISPRHRNRRTRVNSSIEAWNVFSDVAFDVLFIGHVHIPFVFGEGQASVGEARAYDFEYNRPLKLAPDDRYIIAVGSAAYGRDAVGKLRYAIWDPDSGTIEHRAIPGELLPLDYARHMTGR